MQATPRPTSPTWEHLDLYKRRWQSIFELFQPPDRRVAEFLPCAAAVRNSVILLGGTYGSGKTQLVQLIWKALFQTDSEDSESLGHVACTQDLTLMDTLYTVDLARLVKGEEVVSPRRIVTARLKFLNEIQRASSLVHDGLLSLLSERKVVYRDQAFHSPDFMCILDANPHDSGSSTIPSAFLDRIDYSVDLAAADTSATIRLLEILQTKNGMHWGDLTDLLRPVKAETSMESIWSDVLRVSIDAEARIIASMIVAHVQRCSEVDRSTVSPDFPLPCPQCSFKGDTCAKLKSIPGTRFLLSMLRLAQARAWTRGSDSVEIDDLLYGLPFTLNHRLKVRADAARLYPNTITWIIEELYKNGLRQKVPRWRQVVHILERGMEKDALLWDLAHRDLAVNNLVNDQLKGRGAAGNA